MLHPSATREPCLLCSRRPCSWATPLSSLRTVFLGRLAYTMQESKSLSRPCTGAKTVYSVSIRTKQPGYKNRANSQTKIGVEISLFLVFLSFCGNKRREAIFLPNDQNAFSAYQFPQVNENMLPLSMAMANKPIRLPRVLWCTPREGVHLVLPSSKLGPRAHAKIWNQGLDHCK